MGFQVDTAKQAQEQEQDLLHILLSTSYVFGSTYDYGWYPVQTREQSQMQQEAQKANGQAELQSVLEERARTLYRRGSGHDKEYYTAAALALVDRAPSKLKLEQQCLIENQRHDYLIFNEGQNNYYIHMNQLRNSVFTTEIERSQHNASAYKRQVQMENVEGIEEIAEDASLRKIYEARYSGNEPSHYASYELFLSACRYRDHLLTAEEKKAFSPLFLCYLRGKYALKNNLQALQPQGQNESTEKKSKKSLKEIVKTKVIQPNKQLLIRTAAPAPRSTFAQVVALFTNEKPTEKPDDTASEIATLEAELENYQSYNIFLTKLQQSPNLDDEDEYETYGKFIENELNKIHVKGYFWGNEADHIKYLRPDNKTAFVDATLKSAPEVSILTMVSKLVPDASASLSFGISANVLLIPLFFYNLHESIEIAKYQKNNVGVKPDRLSQVYKNIQKDRTLLGGQTFIAATLGSFMMNRSLHEMMNFNPIEALVNLISPDSLVSGELSTGLRSAALQALPWWVNLSVTAICGTVLGLGMMAMTMASTWKDPEFSWTHVGASFALGFVAGSLMYASSICPASDNKAVSDVFGLMINGLLGLGLHLSMPKTRYMTPDQKETHKALLLSKTAPSDQSKPGPSSIIKSFN